MFVALFFAFAPDFVACKGYGGGSGYHSSGYSGRSGYGGANSGGGWYWFHHGISDDTGDDQYERENGNSALTNFLIAVLIALGLLGCFYQKLSRQGRLQTLDPKRTAGLLGREAVLPETCLTDPQFYTRPANGVYCTSYIEPGLALRPSRQCTGEIDITFSKQHGGWKMIGDGCDADGRFVIRDGFVALDGKAFWTEVGPGISVSNAGNFDFTSHTFQGTWLADNGREAEYMDFYHEAWRLHGGPNKISSVDETYAPHTLATAVTISSRNACEATKGKGNARMSSTDAKQELANATLVDSSSFDSKSRGAYVPPSFTSAVAATQQSDVNCPATFTPCAALRSQQCVILEATHQYENTMKPEANAARPISYISSVSSEDTYGQFSESMSYSGTIGSQRSRQARLSPSIPLEDEAKDVDDIHASTR